jgi:DNA-binding NtrC family response regulator
MEKFNEITNKPMLSISENDKSEKHRIELEQLLEEQAAAASSYGVADYIAKPFDFADLVEKVNHVLKTEKISRDG